jgi:hypothetical protein
MFTRSGLPQSTPELFPAHIFSQARATGFTFSRYTDRYTTILGLPGRFGS